MSRRPGLTASVVSCLLLLAGCRSGASTEAAARQTGGDRTMPSASPRLPEACGLITTDEVSRVLGDHGDGSEYVAKATPGVTEQECTYSWTSGGSGDEFTVSVFPANGYVQDPSGPAPRPIAGIGDRAFEVSGSYYAQVGDRMVNLVNVQEGEGSDEALLAIAAGRL